MDLANFSTLPDIEGTGNEAFRENGELEMSAVRLLVSADDALQF